MTPGRPRTHASIEAHHFNHAAFEIAHAWTPEGPKKVWSELMRWYVALLRKDERAARQVVNDATRKRGTA